MWTATKDGYFSAVQHRDQPGRLLVRARDSKDLEAVRGKGYDIGRIIAMTDADYPYRALVEKAEWGRYLADSAAGIDYGNFKDAVYAADPARAKVYLGAWRELMHIEDDDWDRDRGPVVAARAAGR
jgi:hypothetical protein